MTSHDYAYQALDDLLRQAKRHSASVMWRAKVASQPHAPGGYWSLCMPNSMVLTSTSVEGVLYQLRRLVEAA